jgi:hypothetical protein
VCECVLKLRPNHSLQSHKSMDCNTLLPQLGMAGIISLCQLVQCLCQLLQSSIHAPPPLSLQVIDVRMLSAVTSSVVEEMLSVRPRTAAGAVWALGMMQFQAPAFMEAAYDRCEL